MLRKGIWLMNGRIIKAANMYVGKGGGLSICMGAVPGNFACCKNS
jgi:hypothetical protein